MPNCQCPECRGPSQQARITVADGLGIAAATLIMFLAVWVLS